MYSCTRECGWHQAPRSSASFRILKATSLIYTFLTIGPRYHPYLPLTRSEPDWRRQADLERLSLGHIHSVHRVVVSALSTVKEASSKANRSSTATLNVARDIMPARDPATSPMIPTSPPQHPNHQPLSPSSSAFSVAPGISSFSTVNGQNTSGEGNTAPGRRKGSFSMFRRVSGQGASLTQPQGQTNGQGAGPARGYGSMNEEENAPPGGRARSRSNAEIDE